MIPVNRRHPAVWTVVSCLVLCLSAPVAAQVLYGSLTGVIQDPSGSSVPNATVTLTNKETGATRTAQTDELGRYNLPNLQAGIYEAKIAAPGFKGYTVDGVEITINTVKSLDAKLEVGAVTEQIVVEASAAVLKTEKADIGAEIAAKTVQDMPLPAYRNYQTLINLVPGATPAAFQNAVVDTPGRALTTNINGTNRNNNNTRVDGATNVFIWLPHHTVYVQPVESIEQVNVTTGSMDAEQGMAGGAAITVSTRSGTNEFHGVGFWYHQNQKLKARHFFDRIDRLPMANMNIFGGTLGGPIKRNKLFFFGSFERTTERSGQVGEYSVPTADVRNGNFSGLTGLSLIYDPATGNPDGTGRQPFPNNIIPSNRISPIWRSIQELAPLPNRAATDAFGLQQNFVASGTFKLDRNNYDFKSNWNVNEKLMIWGKYSRMDAPVTGLVPFGPLVGPAVGAASPGNGDTTVQIPTVGFNLSMSPTMFIDGVFGYTRFDQSVTGLDYGTNWGLERFRIPGTNGGARFASDLRYSGMPVFNHGFSAWGQTATWIPLVRNDRSYTYTTNMSKLVGRHELRWGIDVVRHAMNHWQPETANPRGNLTFGGNATLISGRVAQSINSYAAALLGQITAYSKSVQYFLMQTREWQYGFYLRDRWQITRNLTLNLGLRYEFYPLMHRGERGLERWNPDTNQVFLGGLGSTPRDAGISTNEGMFAPRAGIAYKVNENTVIRAGYGLTPNPLPFSRPLRGLYPATITSSGAAATQFGILTALAQGIPEVPLPDVSSGVLTLPRGLDMGPRSPWSSINRGYIQSWNFTIQRKLPSSFVGSLAYVGTQTTRQLGDRDINAAAPGGDQAGRPFFTRNGPIALNMWDGFASGNYHALQFQMDRQFSGGFFMKNSYTWSKTINMFDDDGWVGLPISNWAPAIRRNRAPAGYDRTHMWVSAFNYDLPFGAGRKFTSSNKAANLLFGGWRTNGIFSAYSGTPFTVTASGISLNAPGSTQTADQVAPLKKVGGIGPGTFYYDPTSFRDPNIGRPSNQFRFGTMGRNALRGPGFFRLDASVFKVFQVAEKVNMEFKSEVYNLTNTPRFGNPQANVSQQVANQVTGEVTNVNNFMAITSADRTQDRQFRFGLRLSF